MPVTIGKSKKVWKYLCNCMCCDNNHGTNNDTKWCNKCSQNLAENPWII